MRPLLALLLVAALTIDPAVASLGPSPTAPRQFIIGMPGRWQSPADRRHQRRWYQADSTVDAYVDVEELADPTWLADEIALYAARAADCDGLGSTWCRREVRGRGEAQVMFIAAGVHAELLWISAHRRAVRLGWRRVVETPTGTLTLDDPPADFAARVFAELPTTLRAEASPATADVDRLLYYVDRALSAPCATAEQRRAVERFVARNLTRIAALAGVSDDGAANPTQGTAEPKLSDRLAMLRAWRAATNPVMTDACEWCRAWAP